MSVLKVGWFVGTASFSSNVTNAMSTTYEANRPSDREYGGVDEHPEKFTYVLRSLLSPGDLRSVVAGWRVSPSAASLGFSTSSL